MGSLLVLFNDIEIMSFDDVLLSLSSAPTTRADLVPWAPIAQHIRFSCHLVCLGDVNLKRTYDRMHAGSVRLHYCFVDFHIFFYNGRKCMRKLCDHIVPSER